MTKRINSIDYLKVFFAILIALAHNNAYIKGAVYAVNFFLIISGFFLAKKFYKKKNEDYNGYDYTKDHIKKLYPHYIFSLIILVFYILFRNLIFTIKHNPVAVSWNNMLENMYYIIPEFFFLQNIGFYTGGLNYPLWQVSTMLIIGYFLYNLLVQNEKITTRFICPLSIIFTFTILNQGTDTFGYYGFLYVPLLRTLASMSIGILLYKFTTLKDYNNLIDNKSGIILNIMSIISFLILFLYEKPGFVCYIFLTIILLELFNENSWINKFFNFKLFKKIKVDNLSYAIYLNHAFIIYFVTDLIDVISRHTNLLFSKWNFNIMYIVILIIYSIITMIIVNKITYKKSQKKEGI